MKFLVQNQPCFGYTGGKPFDATQPALLFLHGAACDHSVWDAQARYFALHGWNVIAVDLPGHGQSAGSARKSISEYSQWLTAFLDNAAIDHAVLVGHSMGSLIALDAAVTLPKRIRKLVLSGVSLPMPVSGTLMNAATENVAQAYDMLTAWGHGRQAQLATEQGPASEPGPSLAQNYRKLLEKAGPGVLLADLQACDHYAPSPNTMDSLQVPTLILLGAEDRLTPPKAGIELAARLAAARTVTLSNAGHGMVYETPDAALEAMIEFLRD